MSASRSKEVLDICDQALLLTPSERDVFLISACGEDKTLRESVDQLLQAIEDSGSFMAVDEKKSYPSD